MGLAISSLMSLFSVLNSLTPDFVSDITSSTNPSLTFQSDSDSLVMRCVKSCSFPSNRFYALSWVSFWLWFFEWHLLLKLSPPWELRLCPFFSLCVLSSGLVAHSEYLLKRTLLTRRMLIWMTHRAVLYPGSRVEVQPRESCLLGFLKPGNFHWIIVSELKENLDIIQLQTPSLHKPTRACILPGKWLFRLCMGSFCARGLH